MLVQNSENNHEGTYLAIITQNINLQMLIYNQDNHESNKHTMFTVQATMLWRIESTQSIDTPLDVISIPAQFKSKEPWTLFSKINIHRIDLELHLRMFI